MAAFSPSTKTISSQFSVTVLKSYSRVLTFRWYVDSTAREGDAGTDCDADLTGEEVGVDGPRKDDKRLILTKCKNDVYEIDGAEFGKIVI